MENTNSSESTKGEQIEIIDQNLNVMENTNSSESTKGEQIEVIDQNLNVMESTNSSESTLRDQIEDSDRVVFSADDESSSLSQPSTTSQSPKHDQSIFQSGGSAKRTAKQSLIKMFIPKSCDPVGMLVEGSGLLPNFKELFALYGLHTLDDFSFFDQSVVESLETMIQQNEFTDTVDLTCQSGQLRYLGRKLARDQLPNYHFAPLEVRKMTQILPNVLKEVREQFTKEEIQLKSKRRLIEYRDTSESSNDKSPTSNVVKKTKLEPKRLTLKSRQLEASGEEKKELELPRTVKDSLLKLANNHAKAALSKINAFWKNVNNYSGAPLELNDIKTTVDSEKNKFQISAKCPVCSTFLALNLVGIRAVSIKNYKAHAFKFHLDVGDSATKLSLKDRPEEKKKQIKISSFFNQPEKTEKQEAFDIEGMEVIIFQEADEHFPINARDEASSDDENLD